MKKWGPYVRMHILFIFLSMQNILSKWASGQEFLSWKFILLYGGVLACLFIYAIFWQQTIKKIPLATAYANKAVTVIWGLIWGYLFFGEGVTLRKLVGAAVIIVGVLIVVSSDEVTVEGTSEGLSEVTTECSVEVSSEVSKEDEKEVRS